MRFSFTSNQDPRLIPAATMNDDFIASLASMSQIDRSDECIDYLIARTEMARRIAIEKSIRLQMSVMTNTYQHRGQTSIVMEPMSPSVGPRFNHDFDSSLMYSGINQENGLYAAIDASSSNPTRQGHVFINTTPNESTATTPTPSRKGHDDLKRLWGIRYCQLVEYKEANGHCNIPQRYADNVELGLWVKDQRSAKAKGKLSPERINLLNEIGFSWRVKCNEDFWNKQYQSLIAYKSVHGDCDVPASYENAQLARWVERQRRAKKNDKMPEERFKRLDDVGFIW